MKRQLIGLLVLFLTLSSCFPRTGKENVPELTFSAFPGPNASLVPVNAKITLFFSTLLDPNSLHPGLLVLLDAFGKTVPTKYEYTPYPESGVSTLTLTPTGLMQTPPVYLNINSIYVVTVGIGIKSAAGDAMTQFHAWSFSTNNSVDITPPTFGGAISAEGLDMGSIKLTWGPAVDDANGTPANRLIYAICYSGFATTCSNKFVPVIVNPAATIDSNGNFNYILKPLRPETTYYFMVRVFDQAGNQDSNSVVTGASTKGGKLYVANFKSNEILGFDHPSKFVQTSGQVRSIKASQNGLDDPYGIFFDKVNNRLYISSCRTVSAQTIIESLDPPTCQGGSNRISIYDNVTNPALSPGKDRKPDRILVNSGIAAADSNLNGPVGLFLDASNGKDTLYVANYVGSYITIYDNLTTLCNNVKAPDGTCSVKPRVTVKSLGLTAPFGLAYDPINKFLYVSNYIQGYRKFNSFSQSYNPDTTPGNTIVVFKDSPMTTSSFYSPIKTLTGFNSPAGLWLEAPTDTLYIANAGCPTGKEYLCFNLGTGNPTIYSGIVAICNISLLPLDSPQNPPPQNLPGPHDCKDSGNVSQVAAQYLAGSLTDFAWPIQMVTTPSGSSSTLYVSDYVNNRVEVFTPNPLFPLNTTSTVHSNTLPSQEIYGLNYEIQKPVGIAVGDDLSGNDSLYLANLGGDQVHLYDQISQNFSQCTPFSPSALYPTQCSFPPSRRISPSIYGPAGVFLNNSPDLYGVPRDRLFVTNFSNDSVLMFDSASVLTSGNNYTSISKLITSSTLHNPFGIYVDTLQQHEWVYVINSRPDATGPNAGKYALVVFDMANCPGPAVACDEPIPHAVIYSDDFDHPAGIWVDHGVGINNQTRDTLYVSNRGLSDVANPGFITIFSNASQFLGTVINPPSKKIAGDQTYLFVPTGLFMDPVKDQLYIANQGYNDILVFNQPETCTVTVQPNTCNILPDRTIYNTIDILHSLDGPSSLVIDFSADQIYLANLGLYNHLSSLLTIKQASTVNGEASISNYLSRDSTNISVFPLNFPEALTLDITR